MQSSRPIAIRALRRTKSTAIFDPKCRCTNVRYLQTTACLYARPATRASPRVARARVYQKAPTRTQPSSTLNDFLIPKVLMDSARKQGALDVETEEVNSFLTEYYSKMSHGSTTGWEQNLCAKHGISPPTVAVLAGLLLKCDGGGQRLMAKKLMLVASSLGDKSATFAIIMEALKSGSLHDYQATLRKLDTMANVDHDPQAMLLLGKVSSSQNRINDALRWYQECTRPPYGTLDFWGSGEALILEAKILMDQKDFDGAGSAFKRAALELDEPEAYFYLSRWQEPGSRAEGIYLLKAASSGVPEAMHNLGSIELEKFRKTNKKPKELRDFGMATEWSYAAAHRGFGSSMLNLALMCWEIGESEDAWTWLSRAEKINFSRDKAKIMRTQFEKGVTPSIVGF